MIKKEVIIQLKDGVKPETLAQIVQAASKFDSKIHLNYTGRQVNAKSIMGVMALGFVYGEEVIVSAEGADESDAIEKMVAILG